jgi:DNA repair exonuclease SbcCD ATPase subunit
MNKTIKLNGKNSKINVVYHLADVHIRNDESRHDEYEQVFKQLFSQMKNEKETFVTVVCGDILHDKTTLRPNTVKLLKKFFYEMAKYSDIIVIPGNHDCNINNEESMDALTPTIGNYFASKHNVFVCKESGVYEYNNILFGITSLYDDEIVKCKGKQTKIALYHGTIYGSKLDNKIEMKEKTSFKCSDFKEYDYVMLGDIHKHQYLNKKKTIAYSSSLIQQNYGEEICGHGFIRWDLKNEKSKFIEVKNEYYFKVIKVETKSELDKIEFILPSRKYPRLRIDYTTPELKKYFKKFRDSLKATYDNADIRFNELLPVRDISLSFSANGKNNIGDVDNMEDVKKVIKSYVDTTKISKKRKANVINHINLLLKDKFKERKHKNVLMSLNKITFDNLMPYGSKNCIDFTKFKDIVGIVAPNYTGKSSLIDILLFSIFGKTSRSNTLHDAINRSKTSAKCELSLIGNNKTHVIKRDMKYKYGNKKSNRYNLYHFIDKKNKSESKPETQKNIEDFLCNYDDLVRSSISLQSDTGFLDMKISQRKKYVLEIINFDIFNEIIDTTKKESNLMRDKLKDENKRLNKIGVKKDIAKNKKENIKKISEIEKKIKLCEKEMKNKENNIAKFKTVTFALKIDDDIIDNVDEFYRKHKKMKTQIDKEKSEYDQNTLMLEKMKDQQMKLEKLLKNENDILKKFDEWTTKKKRKIKTIADEIKKNERNMINIGDCDKNKLFEYQINHGEIIKCIAKKINKLGKLNFEIREMEVFNYNNKYKNNDLEDKYEQHLNNMQKMTETLEHLDKLKVELSSVEEKNKKHINHKYNPDCNVCMSNSLTVDKLFYEKKSYVIEKEIELTKKEISKLQDIVKSGKYLEKKMTKLSDVKNMMDEYDIIINNKKNEIIKIENELDMMRMKKDILFSKIEIFSKLEKQSKNNILFEKKIKNLNEKLSEIQNEKLCEYEEYILNKDRYDGVNVNMNKLLVKINNSDIINKMNKYNKNNGIIDQLKKLKIVDIKKESREIKQYKIKLDDFKKNKLKLQKKNAELDRDLLYIRQIEKEIAKMYDKEVLNKDISSVLNISKDSDGFIKYMMNKQILPTISANVNGILQKIVDFKILMRYQKTGKFDGVEVYKKLSNGYELASYELKGSEKFIVNIVFKIVFSKMNTRLKTNFFIIDEGFSCCDDEHLEKIKYLFQYLKENYKWCLVVSHLEEIKKYFDTTITIKKVNGDSKIIV